MNKYSVRRYVLFIISLFINAFGIAFITRALLGTSPITSVTYVLSMFTPLTIGQWTILFNLLFVALEPLLMKRNDLKSDLRIYLLQIPITFCFGLFIDVSMGLLSWIQPAEYVGQLGYLLVGCIILAAGITLEVKSDIAMVAGEYFVKVISRHFHKEFGYVKLGFDITLVVLACLLSLVFMSGIKGVREGTVIAALLVGPIVHCLTPFYRFLDKWIKEPEAGIQAESSEHVIITIAREYGSGGHLLGELLSKALGLPLYDRAFIRMAARKSGMDEQYIRENEQSIPSFWLKCMLSQNDIHSLEHSLSSDDILFVAESRIIQELARKESCIIVGRCADFILRERPNVVKVFCYSDIEKARLRCINDYHLPDASAVAEIRRINHNRITHYEYYTGEKWGEPHRYDFVVNTGTLNPQTACHLIKTYMEQHRILTPKS